MIVKPAYMEPYWRRGIRDLQVPYKKKGKGVEILDFDLMGERIKGTKVTPKDDGKYICVIEGRVVLQDVAGGLVIGRVYTLGGECYVTIAGAKEVKGKEIKDAAQD